MSFAQFAFPACAACTFSPLDEIDEGRCDHVWPRLLEQGLSGSTSGSRNAARCQLVRTVGAARRKSLDLSCVHNGKHVGLVLVMLDHTMHHA